MTRKQLAEAAGLSYPYIAQIETGYRLPSAKHHRMLAGVLGMSLDELFGSHEGPHRGQLGRSGPDRAAGAPRR